MKRIIRKLMENKVNVSIIIPHYNSAQLLDKLLNSIPAKKDIQIIVIDDNSTRDVDILHEVVKKNVAKIEFYTNDTQIQSAGACRNIGLQHAIGKWLLFADADDYFLDNMYETIAAYFDSDNDIIFFPPTSVYIDTQKVADRHIFVCNLFYEYLHEITVKTDFKIRTKWGQPWSKLIRKQVVDENGIQFSTSLHYNDTVFSAMVGFYARKLAVVDKEIYCITQSRGSLTTIESENAYFIRLNEKIKEFSFIWSHYDKKLCSTMHLTGARSLYEALFVKKLGIRKVCKIAGMYRKAKVPLFTVYNFNPAYIVQGRKNFHAIDLEQKKKEKYIVRE